MIKQPNNSPIDALVDLACRDGVDVRPTLLRVLTDLYVQKPIHSADEETQYLELALGLIDAVDDATRAAVAARLSAYPAAPRAILERLGGAAPAASAEAAPLIPTGRESLREAFFAASPEERRLILLNLEAGATAHPAPPAHSEIVRLLENAALARNTGEFARTLERALWIGPELAARIVGDPSGEPIVVAARALGMKAAVLQRVLLFLDPAIGQSVQRVYDLAQLFDELPRAAAERMIDIWRNGDAPTRSAQKPVYEGVYGEDGARDHRALSTRRATPLPGRQSERTRGAR